MIYNCVLRLVTDMPHVLDCWFLNLVALSCCASAGCLGPEGWQHTNEMDTEHLTNQHFIIIFIIKRGMQCKAERE